jgi:hypothetical protein
VGFRPSLCDDRHFEPYHPANCTRLDHLSELDLNNDADKEFIEKSFDWTLEIDGKKWADGECDVLSIC